MSPGLAKQISKSNPRLMRLIFSTPADMKHIAAPSGAGVGVGMFMVLCFCDCMVLWFYGICGFMVSWFRGFMVLSSAKKYLSRFFFLSKSKF